MLPCLYQAHSGGWRVGHRRAEPTPTSLSSLLILVFCWGQSGPLSLCPPGRRVSQSSFHTHVAGEFPLESSYLCCLIQIANNFFLFNLNLSIFCSLYCSANSPVCCYSHGQRWHQEMQFQSPSPCLFLRSPCSKVPRMLGLGDGQRDMPHALVYS